MLRAFTNAFKIPDLRGKILFTLAIIAVYRFGSFVPIPGVDYGVLQSVLDQVRLTGISQLLNLFSGGALTQLAVFARGDGVLVQTITKSRYFVGPDGDTYLVRASG